MFKINRKLEYALISLRHMSAKSPGQLTSAKEVCDIYRTPFDPTSRVLQIMAQHGIVHAEQGVKGGYQVIKDLSKVSMRELSDMIIGPIEIANCFHGNYSTCEINHTCHIIAPMLNLNDHIKKLFDKMSVSELIESKHHGAKSIKEKAVAKSAANKDE